MARDVKLNLRLPVHFRDFRFNYDLGLYSVLTILFTIWMLSDVITLLVRFIVIVGAIFLVFVCAAKMTWPALNIHIPDWASTFPYVRGWFGLLSEPISAPIPAARGRKKVNPARTALA